MSAPDPPALRASALTVLAIALATAARFALDPFLGDSLPYTIFVVPVVLASWYGGWKGGLFATALCGVLAVFCFVPPRLSFAGMDAAGWIGLGLFALVSLALAAFIETQRRAQVRLRETQADLAQQREWLRITLASIGDAVVATDATGRVTLMNAVAERLTGWQQQQALQQPLERVFQIVDERTRQPVTSPVAKVMRDGQVVGLANHTLLVARDGTEWTIDDSAAPIRDAGGRLVGVVRVFRDVSDRRRAEHALEESEARKTAIVEAGLDGIISIDHEGHVIEFNAAAERTFGLRRQQVIGRELADFVIPPAMRGKHRAGLANFLATGRSAILGRRLELTAIRADGEEFPVELAIIRLPGKEPPVFTGYLRDITERKQAERAFAESDRRKDEFLATLAHELRNPLAPLRNGLQILTMAKDDRRAVEHAHALMERQLGQLIRLVDDLLDLSRVSRGKLDLHLERIDLCELLQQVVESNRLLPECVQEDISVHLPPEPVYLLADPVRLGQIFANLFSNACKFTPKEGRIVLTVEVRPAEVCVCIRDTGVGIACEMLPRIFEMFTQADQRPEKAQRGLGIGLTLVRRLVEMHGGTVEAASAGAGQGSEFTVRLPLLAPLSMTAPAAVEAAAPAPVTAPAPAFADAARPAAASGTLSAPHPQRILVVDDNQDSATSLAMLLRLMGSEVREVYDATAALELAASFDPDVIILDIGMPGMNGHDAARHIRAQDWGRRAVLIALTGWGQAEDLRRSREAGFDHHLVKPVNRAALVELLGSIAGGRQPPSAIDDRADRP